MTPAEHSAREARRAWWGALCIAIARRYRADLSPYHPINTAVRAAWHAADGLARCQQ